MPWPYLTPGIPDELFEREEGIPMTKQEIRALSISMLRLIPHGAYLDLGSGTGSISVEVAHISRGWVLALDVDCRATALTLRNVKRFGLEERVDVVCGEADLLPLKADELFDGVFLGGGLKAWGNVVDRLKRGGRLVANAITLESAAALAEGLSKAGLPISVLQIFTARGSPSRAGTIMLARNPIYIIVGEKRACDTPPIGGID